MNPATGEHDTEIGVWRPEMPGGESSEELLVAFYEGRKTRILVLPAWFDEANRMRRFAVEAMRLLHLCGIDSMLPDMPGCNESLAPLNEQTIAGWRECAEEVAKGYGATHVLAIRAGALIAPPSLPGWRYAPQTGPKLLRAMIRASIIAAREAGREETSEGLLELGRNEGLTLAGWPIGAAMIRELESTEPLPSDNQQEIAQSEIGGAGLWLRAEPDFDGAQAEAIVNIINTARTSTENGAQE
ncbi:MAG: hypothetical protein AAF687_04815 [Pseudomonadota bacterium]